LARVVERPAALEVHPTVDGADERRRATGALRRAGRACHRPGVGMARRAQAIERGDDRPEPALARAADVAIESPLAIANGRSVCTGSTWSSLATAFDDAAEAQ
jgi:hypothetical protein